MSKRKHEIQDDWQNPQITGRGKLPGRFMQLPFDSVSQARSGDESRWAHSLNGKWDFRWFPCPSDIPEKLDKWDSIPVPANWELHGFGTPQYLNMDYPPGHDTRHLPRIDPRDNPTGLYRKKFMLPGGWSSRKKNIILRFEGIRSAAHIRVNGHDAGYTQNSYSPSEFQIGEYLKSGTNELTVTVYKWCAGTYLEDQDVWRLGGIIRPVSLIAPPEGGVFDVYARCRFDTAFRRASLDITVESTPGPDGRQVSWHLFDGEESVVSGSPEPVSPNHTNEFQAEVDYPKLWSAEEPHLYDLAVVISDADGKELDVRRIPWGFRQIDIESGPQGAVLKLNGRPVKLLGVNRRDMHPRLGQAVTPQIIESDLILMKQNNINAVRCSHYPNPQALYEAAGRLGLYVIDETGIESRGRRKKLPASKSLWTENCLDRAERMVRTNRNYPAVISWSPGNEAGYGKNFKRAKQVIKKTDRTRPVHCEGDIKLKTTDLFSLMYPDVSLLHKVGRRQPVRRPPAPDGSRRYRIGPKAYKNKPFIMCGIAHATGNSLGNFAEYMEAVRRYPNIAGGFVRDFADQALYKTDGQGRESLAYGGDFDEQQHDGIFCANGIFTADRLPRPELEELRALYLPVAVTAADLPNGLVTLVNRHDFIRLSAYEIQWSVEYDGVPAADGTARELDIPPQGKRDVRLFSSLSAFTGSGEGFLNLSVCLKDDCDWAPAGFEMGRMQLPLPENTAAETVTDSLFSHLGPLPAEQNDSQETDIRDTDDWKWQDVSGSLVIAGKKSGLRLSLETGDIETLDFGRGNVLEEPMRPDFFRAPTGSKRREQHRRDQAGRRLKSREIKTCGGVIEIRLKITVPGFAGPLRETLRLNASGALEVTLCGRPRTEMIRFGMRTALPLRFRKVSWFGRGPGPNHDDRKTGSLVGLYEKDVEDLSFDYLKPRENANRADVRRLSFSGDGTLTFKAEQPFSFSASPVSGEELARASHTHEIQYEKNIQLHIDSRRRGAGGSIPGFMNSMDRCRMKPNRANRLCFTMTWNTP